MSKQDRQGARTVADLERRLNTRKTFAEAMGLAEEAKKVADAASEQANKAQSAVDGIDHEAVWNWLTENGLQQGFFKHKGQVYVNVAYLKGGKIAAELIDGSTLIITKGSTIAGWNIDNKSIYKTPDGAKYEEGTFMHVGTGTAYSIGGSAEIPGWVFGAGGKFGVTKDGVVYANDVHLTGEINASEGTIGDWHIGETEVSTPNGTVVYSGIALYSDYLYDNDKNSETRITLTPEAVYIDGRDSTGASVYEHATWQKIIKAASLV
jgi:hypothetical protein